MTGTAPDPASLEPIERASQAELRALQLERLKWTLAHAYENVPHYQRRFDAAGVKPSDLTRRRWSSGVTSCCAAAIPVCLPSEPWSIASWALQ